MTINIINFTKSPQLATYLATAGALGAGTASTNAAVLIYGDGAPTPDGIDVVFKNNYSVGDADSAGSNDSFFGREGLEGFTRGTNLTFDNGFSYGNYAGGSGFTSGAEGSDQNYAAISFNGNDGVYEAVGQFSFTGSGGGFLVALAFADTTTLADGTTLLTDANKPTNLGTLTNTQPLTISEGFDMINASGVPEPSSLALLALGSMGLAARRSRRKAA